MKPGMRIWIRSDPLILSSGSGTFSSDPDPDPICNNGYIKSTNSSLKLCFIESNFLPAYLIYRIRGKIFLILTSEHITSVIFENIFSASIVLCRSEKSYII